MALLTRQPVKSWSVPKFDHRDASLVLYLPLWYQYSDMTGSTIYSYDRNRHTCALTGTTWGTKGRTFDGVDDLIDCGSASVLDDIATTTGGVTYLAWINPTSVGEGGAGRISQKSTVTGDAMGSKFYTFDAVNPTIGFEVDYATTDIWREAKTDFITLGVWQLVGCTWTGSATATTVKLYVNTVESSSYQQGVNGVGAYVSDADYNQLIGNTPLGARTFDGIIGDCWIYNRVISAREHLGLYESTKWRYR